MKKSLQIFLLAVLLLPSASCSINTEEENEQNIEIWNPADHPTAYNCENLEYAIAYGFNDPAKASPSNPAMLWYNYWCL